MAALENVALWHERDISHSSVERVILPDSFIALDHMLRRFTRIVSGHGRLSGSHDARTSQRSRGVVFSGTVLLELARRGISREQAYEWVQRNAMRSFHEQRDFKALLLADADVIGGAVAERGREGVRSRRAAAQRGRDLRPGVRRTTELADRGRDASPEAERQPDVKAQGVRHAEAVGVRSAGADHRRRAALAGLRRRRRRAAGQVLRARV